MLWSNFSIDGFTYTQLRKKKQPPWSFLQRGCSEKFHAQKSPFLVRKFQDVGFQRNLERTVFRMILLYFKQQPSLTVLVLSPLSKNDYVAYKTNCVKSVQIWSYFWSVFSCIRTRNNSLLGPFSRSETNTR